MAKKFLSVGCLLFAVMKSGFSQTTPLRIIVEDQYETLLRETAIVVASTGKRTATDARGIATIEVSVNDSIKIDHPGYDSAAVSLKKITKENVIRVRKNFSWKDLLTPMFYIINGGLWLVLFIIFAETGLFAGFFLPGDSLLFVAGIYNRELISTTFPFVENDYMQLIVLWLLVSIAGIIGNTAGYIFGKRVGPTMYTWKNTLLFKQKYLQDAHDFYERHGGGAIIIARFLPIVRTFAPIVAGIVDMDKKKFGFYNILGCFMWVFSMLVAGHFLQKWIYSQFGFNLKEHLEVIVVGIVLVTTAPVLIKLFFVKKKKA